MLCTGKIRFLNRPKADIKKDLDKYGLDMNLFSTPMSKCTMEEKNELERKNIELRNELQYLKSMTEKEMYLDDLKNLRSDIQKDFQ